MCVDERISVCFDDAECLLHLMCFSRHVSFCCFRSSSKRHLSSSSWQSYAKMLQGNPGQNDYTESTLSLHRAHTEPTLSLHWVYTVPPLKLNSGVMLNCSIYRVSTANQKAWRSLTRQACCKVIHRVKWAEAGTSRAGSKPNSLKKHVIIRDTCATHCARMPWNHPESVCVGFAAVLSCLLTLLMLLS